MPSNPLFSTFRNKTLSLENCIVMAPMARARSPNGVPTYEVAAYYRRRVEGGVGLIINDQQLAGRVERLGYPWTFTFIKSRNCLASYVSLLFLAHQDINKGSHFNWPKTSGWKNCMNAT